MRGTQFDWESIPFWPWGDYCSEVRHLKELARVGFSIFYPSMLGVITRER
jgi:hypothetical protein